MNDQTTRNNENAKPGCLSRLKKIALITLFIIVIIGFPVLVRVSILYKNFTQPMDLDSALIMTQWSDDTIAGKFKNIADTSKAVEMNKLQQFTFAQVQDLRDSTGPWCLYDKTELEKLTQLFEPQEKIWKDLIEKNQVFLSFEADNYRRDQRTYAEMKSIEEDRNNDLNTSVHLWYFRNWVNILKARIYSEIDRGNYDQAMETNRFLIRLGNPGRAEHMNNAQIAAAYQFAGARVYRNLLNQTPPQNIWQNALQDLIDVRQFMGDDEMYQHMRMREAASNMMQFQVQKQGIENNPDMDIDDTYFSDAAEQLQWELRSALSVAVVDCFNKHALFSDDSIRQKAAANAGKYKLQIPYGDNPLELYKFAKWADWYHRVARKETAIFDTYGLPQAIREKTEPFTAMLYLQTRYVHAGPDAILGKQTQVLLTELAIASKIYRQEYRQWPQDLQSLEKIYMLNNVDMPNDPFGEKDVWHLGWLTLDESTRRIFWMEQMALEHYPMDIQYYYDMRRADTELAKQRVRSAEDKYMEWSENPSSATLIIKNWTDNYTDAAKARDYLSQRKGIVEKAILEVRYLTESGIRWTQIDTETAKQIDREIIRIKKAWQAKENMESPFNEAPLNDEDNKATSNTIQTMENDTEIDPTIPRFKLPDAKRLRLYLKAPEKAFAVWRNPPPGDEYNDYAVQSDSGEIDLRFTIFPEKF